MIRCGRSREGWFSDWLSVARCSTGQRCCCSTSREPTWIRPRRELAEPLIGRAAGATRVITSHEPQAALAEADLVLGLKHGRAALLGEPGHLNETQLRELYV